MSKRETLPVSTGDQHDDWHPALVMSQNLGVVDKFDTSETKEDDEDAALVLIVRDGLDMPIEGLRLYFTFPWGEQATGKTSAQGALAIPLTDANRKGHVKVEVHDVKHQKQQICTLDLTQCKKPFIVSSQKVKVDVSLRPHEQAPPTLPLENAPHITDGHKPFQKASMALGHPWWIETQAANKAWDWLRHVVGVDQKHESHPQSANAVLAQGLNNNGNHITVVVGPEGPNKDNLRMGRNNVYREIVITASKRLGLVPQSLCALIDCEAGKITEWIDLIGPDGKAYACHAAGIFHSRTEHQARLGTAARNATKGIKEQNQNCFRHQIKNGMGFCVFKWKNHKCACQIFKRCERAKMLADADGPEWSINASADYGASNSKRLEGRGYKLTGMNDMDRAKLMYLFHHEGDEAGFLFIEKKFSQLKGGLAALRATFERQLSSAEMVSNLVKEANGDIEKAYRQWLAKYIDRRFSESYKYFLSNPLRAQDLSDLIVKLGGPKV